MINYVINRFGFADRDFKDVLPCHDGSMHHHASFSNLYMHHRHLTDWQNFKLTETRTTAPSYPLLDATFQDVNLAVAACCPDWPTDKKILLTSSNLKSASLNLIFQYHKVAHGVRQAGMEIFYSGIAGEPYKQWNRDHTNFACMSRWEFREWFSVSWKGMAQNFVVDTTPLSDWLVFDNQEFITDLSTSVKKIMTFCGFKYSIELDKFLKTYKDAQQYVIDDFDLVDKICSSIIDSYNFEWHDTNVIVESLVQSHLRDQGFEIKCHGLDQFPSNSKDLYNLLEKV